MAHYYLIMKEEQEKKGGGSIRKGKEVNGERNGEKSAVLREKKMAEE